MSDLAEAKQKVQKGVDWRGTVHVDIDDEPHEFCIRQLKNVESEEVMSMLDTDELKNLREGLPEDSLEEYRELQTQEELTDDEEERLSELQEEVEEHGSNPFDALSQESLEALRLAAKYGAEPDEEDMREALHERASEIESEYGIKVREPEDTREALKDDLAFIIDSSTDFIAFTLGMAVLGETLGEEGNLDV